MTKFKALVNKMQRSDLMVMHVYDRIFRNPYLVLDHFISGHFISYNTIQKEFIN